MIGWSVQNKWVNYGLEVSIAPLRMRLYGSRLNKRVPVVLILKRTRGFLEPLRCIVWEERVTMYRSKLTPFVRKQLVNCIEIGMPIGRAALAVGICHRTFDR